MDGPLKGEVRERLADNKRRCRKLRGFYVGISPGLKGRGGRKDETRGG